MNALTIHPPIRHRVMRTTICVGGLLGAGLLTLLAIGSAVQVVSDSEKADLSAVLRVVFSTMAALLWLWCGLRLFSGRRSRLIWAGSLAGNLVLVLLLSTEFIRLQALLSQATHGDPQVPLDPAVGIPWICSAIFTLASVGLLIGLGALPAIDRQLSKSSVVSVYLGASDRVDANCPLLGGDAKAKQRQPD